ncbi:hypothetical protein QFC20_000948 [Naganishia adeliensis]|uniref:Uncharacterized protein n=1 Tax=Naganishia adeliensis TaxID=92952 RepID=A0ACC2WYN5_9TREE|nr:hypothetical protein QFC20_000948 [Naganishia adeliensis]
MSEPPKWVVSENGRMAGSSYRDRPDEGKRSPTSYVSTRVTIASGERLSDDVGVEGNAHSLVLEPDSFKPPVSTLDSPSATRPSTASCVPSSFTTEKIPTNPSIIPQQNYVDYHKCINAKGEDFAPCKQFKRAYQSLCPSEYRL